MSPFREKYLRYEELTRILHEWARAHPDFVRVTSIGSSAEGRELWLAEIGREPDRRRAAAWIDGNMHAVELCGSSVALAIAEDVIALHRGEDRYQLPEHVRERLKGILFYVLPRMSPDGAEAVLRDGRYVRSNPRDRREHAPVPRWVAGDVNGDGVVLSLRRQDPSGEFVEDPELPGVMLPRRLEDAGPFYKVWPEGTIENYDGVHVPDPHFLSDNDIDLNRNFPYAWKPEPEQVGAGPYGASDPESRAVIDWATAHPNIFSWLNLHTFGGVYIRPLGDAPDKKMNQEDLAIYRQI
ncbi:MAG TPA: M14 family metallopeptidase, partial [Burkholderiales bacterium]|nr:M14 family metallopeptidase [Burkholderiales bacterium]